MSERPHATHPLLRLLQLLTLLGVSLLLGLLVWRLTSSQRGKELVNAVRKSEKPPAPEFSLRLIWRNGATWPLSLRRTLNHDQIRLSSLRGRVVVLNFWASWCIPCKREAGLLADGAQRHRGDVLFLGVDVQDLTSDARAFLRHYRVRYPSVHDNSGATYDDYGLTALPETYWLDDSGRVVAHYAGEISSELLERGIAGALR